MIRIISKREGFRRCGVPHSKNPTDWPDDYFSEEQIERLKAEPRLTVKVLKDEAKADAKAKAKADAEVKAKADAKAKNRAKEIDETMTVPMIKKELDKQKIEYSSGAVKKDLIALLLGAELAK